MADNKPILDACCGSKMFWFDKNNQGVLFADIRAEKHILCDSRLLEVTPDIISDFRNMDLPDNQFKVVVFDPPHLNKLGANSWMALKYGRLDATWQQDIQAGFNECFRVLENDGVLIFKWNEVQIKVSEILKLSPYRPMVGHMSGKRSDTHWITFFKNDMYLNL